MAKSPKELLYYIVEGEMTVITDDGIQHVLHAGDSIHMSPDQGRESKKDVYKRQALTLGRKIISFPQTSAV